MHQITVEARDDLLGSFVRDPLQGIVEMIWNALDADATEVVISIEENLAGGVDAVRIRDNGIGMTQEDVHRGFGSLGGSWKHLATATAGGRTLHGKMGRGRYAAFGVGERVTWRTVVEGDGERVAVDVRGRRSDLRHFEVSDPQPTHEPVGTEVFITVPTDSAQSVILRDSTIQNLTVMFALYLAQYESVGVTWRHKRLNPKRYRVHEETSDLGLGAGIPPATLTIIEWDLPKVDRQLYLCDQDGTALLGIPAGIQAPLFNFTAYLRWQPFRDMGHDVLLVDIGGGEGARIVDMARDLMRSHFRGRQKERHRAVIEKWREEEVYPYRNEAASETETTERQVFDLVALAAERVLNESKPKARRLSLRLLREALETSPSSLHRVLSDVLELPAESVDELRQMLDRTTLSRIIQSARVIGDRLDFLALLDTIIWEKEAKKQTLERDQLHRLLEREPWVFGEEWAIATSDWRLTAVLKQHLRLLGDEIDVAANEPALMPDGRDCRPDLVLWRAAQSQQNRLEHLVVELKRPSLKLTSKEVQQIESYATAVVSDGRFNVEDVHWEFWLVGDDVDKYTENRRHQSHLPVGVIQRTDDYTIYVKRWAEVLRDALHRHKFVQRSLDFETTRDLGVNRMREKYNEYLPPSLAADQGEEAV